MLDVKQAADYLDYNALSIHRLLKQNILRCHRMAGKTILILREDLDRYKRQNAWAARKAKLAMPEQTPPTPPECLEADVFVDLPLGVVALKLDSIKEFSWDMIPQIRARIDHQHGNIPFDIAVASPDGGTWKVEYQPPSWLGKMIKRVRGGR